MSEPARSPVAPSAVSHEIPPAVGDRHDEDLEEVEEVLDAAEVAERRRAALVAASTELYEDAQLYDHEYRRRRADVRWYLELAARLAQEAGVESMRILELGCGTGRLLLPLVRAGHRVLGVDRAAPMLRRCGERLGGLGRAARSRAQLVRADFCALPLGPSDAAQPGAGRFPLILCPFNSFMHLYTRQDAERFLGEVRRLLAPDGVFAFDVLNPDPSWLARDPERRWSRTRFRHPQTGEPFVYSTNHAYDSESQIAWIRIYYEPADTASRPPGDPGTLAAARTVHLAQRQFYPAELEALLHYNGFTLSSRAGGFDGQVLTPASAEQVICARLR